VNRGGLGGMSGVLGTPPEQPTFRSTTTLIDVYDHRARFEGRPVTDLTKEEISITEKEAA